MGSSLSLFSFALMIPGLLGAAQVQYLALQGEVIVDNRRLLASLLLI